MYRPDAKTITVAALALVALAVLFLLPRFVSEPLVTVAPDLTPQPSPMTVSPATAAQKTRFRAQSQDVLASIFTLQEALEKIQVIAWAEAGFGEAQALVAEGDRHYSLGKYQEALASYQQALNQLQALEKEGADKLASALRETPDAIEAGQVTRVAELVALLNQLAPDDPQVKTLNTRAASLPAVLEQLNLGRAAVAENRLADANGHFAKAVALDPDHRQAKALLQEVAGTRQTQGFNQLMGDGYSAMERGDFAAAEGAFARAAQVDPGNGAVAQARAQLDNRRLLDGVDHQLAQARQLEQVENWAQAVTLYQGLIAQDGSLTEPRVRLIPAQVRADLDRRMAELIADPLALSRADIAAKAHQALADAKSIGDAGDKLAAQIDQLSTLLEQSLRPVAVAFQSDGLTQVTLYRIEKMGAFESRVMELKPGKYTVAGVRQGYRDVVVEFTVTGEPLAAPVVVRCTESI